MVKFNNKGFTMIEMIIVISIISMLLMLIVPNLKEKQALISQKGCDALKEMVNSQIYLYELKYNTEPKTINDLIEKKFITKEQQSCSNGLVIIIKDNEAFIK